MTTFDAIAFAGGGARCYWQSGFWEAFSARHPQKPRFVVGVSAGAYQACYTLIGMGGTVRERVIAGCAATPSAYDWPALARGASPFVVGRIFRDFLAEIFGPAELAALKRAPEVLIQVTHPPRFLPGVLLAVPAIAAYQLEKMLTGAAHSSAGARLGLRPDWISTHAIATPAELVEALMATASVPPFMPVGRVNGRDALDGGLVDNPPLLKLREVEAAGGRTLVLSTRFNRAVPQAPGRTVAGPSEDIAVDKFTVTDGAGILRAYELGLKDGEAFAKAG